MLAWLAMLAHVLAASFCPNMASHQSATAHFDSVLGWITLCLAASPDNGADQDKTGGDQNKTGHGNLCAALCAAVVTTVAAFAALNLSLVIVPAVTAVRFLFAPLILRQHAFYGGVGSRAPPALV